MALQELGGQFQHTFQVEHVHSKHDITCHSKSRRNKKKKIPLVTNEEVDMNLSTPAIQGHRVEGSKKFMIFKMLHFPSFSSIILQG